jgi:hypothetical protein
MNNAQFCSLVEKAIEEFSLLIQFDESEQKFQSFFEDSSPLFQALGYMRAIPHPVIESEGLGDYIPDFIVQRDDGFWQILELKRPDTKVLKNHARRDTWYADMQSYLSQCIDYIELLRDQSVRSKFERRYGVTMHLGFPVTIVAGLSEQIDQLRAVRLLDRFKENISLVAFDQALASMQAWYSGKYPQSDQWSGSTIALLYQLDPFENANGYVFDVGWERDKNRISLFRRSEDILALRMIDANGLSMTSDFISPDKAVGRSVALMISIFPVDDIFRVVLEADGLQIVDIRSSNLNMNLRMPAPTILGNNMEGSGSAHFVDGMFLTRTPALSMSERARLREYMQERCYDHRENHEKTIKGIRFGTNQFMYNIGHPHFDPDHEFETHMVQRDDDCRPTAC